MQITVKNVEVQEVQKGKGRPYSVATVEYDFNGNARTQKVMSFTNPGVFAVVKDLASGDVVDVDVTKNAQGYNEWAKVTKAAAGASPAPQTQRSTGSNYETREERQQRQVYIIRQSSLAQAVQFLSKEEDVSINQVLDVADRFVDYVMNGNSPQMDGTDEEVS